MNKQKKSKKGISLIVLEITIIVMLILAAASSSDNSNKWLLTTGAVDNFKINNVYDMAGNVDEWTMEGVSNKYRAYRGGSFSVSGTINVAAARNNHLSLSSGT